MSYKNKKEQVWGKGKKVRGKDPNLYRRDDLGNEIYYHSYGKNTPMGWEIDHSKPQSKGGTDHLNNLRPLQTEENRKKGNKY
ncbi:HNH endonuclease signature motif containing protein [Tenacibaculum agarivorans]|uniref:HNH endonuclease signature motif containing protein n=1 Tax=Tenacibaculum agarivorans TaxID=1908389 RepID=UPI00094BC277|nr:HNH endonuclease signature motif containing protein [Tenacibaculum agarivorans]